MKKSLKIFSLVVIVVILCGCGIKQKKTTVNCKLSQKNPNNGYELKATYTIYATNGVVDTVKTTEEITSNEESILNYFNTNLNSTYENYNNKYGGYKYKVIMENGKVTSTVSIDYSKMDLKKLVKDNMNMKSAINNENKLKLEGIKSIYKSVGAICN